MIRTTEATVLRRLSADRVLLRLPHGCGGEGGGCGGCGACGGDRGGPPELAARTDRSLAPGDRVEVELNLPDAATAALWAFGMPLLLAVIGGAAAYAMLPVELAPAVGGAAGLALGFLVLAVADRRADRRGARVRIVRVLSETE